MIGCTGSIATIRIVQIIIAFQKNFNLRIIFTKPAKFFSDEVIKDYAQFEMENDIKFYYDEDEWSEYKTSQQVLHIELRKWADAILLAPLSANTLAKITNGICDNLLVNRYELYNCARLVLFGHGTLINLDFMRLQ